MYKKVTLGTYPPWQTMEGEKIETSYRKADWVKAYGMVYLALSGMLVEHIILYVSPNIDKIMHFG